MAKISPLSGSTYVRLRCFVIYKIIFRRVFLQTLGVKHKQRLDWMFNGNNVCMWLCVFIEWLQVWSSNEINVVIICTSSTVSVFIPLAEISLQLFFCVMLRIFPFSVKPQIKCVLFWTEFASVVWTYLIWIFQIRSNSKVITLHK